MFCASVFFYSILCPSRVNGVSQLCAAGSRFPGTPPPPTLTVGQVRDFVSHRPRPPVNFLRSLCPPFQPTFIRGSPPAATGPAKSLMISRRRRGWPSRTKRTPSAPVPSRPGPSTSGSVVHRRGKKPVVRVRCSRYAQTDLYYRGD